MAEKIVQIDHVTKKYKERTVLDDVSLSIWTGDIIGLLGGNGAGKTTLMRAIAGSIPVDSGKKLAGRYSLGMKQRLGIAVAMLGDPRLLILDEPLNGLDVQGMQDLEERLWAMHEDRSIGILISSHVIGELVKLCNRYLVMDHGRICMEYTREELLQQAGSEEAVEDYIITRFQKTT